MKKKKENIDIIFIRECFPATPDGNAVQVEAAVRAVLIDEKSGTVELPGGILAIGVEQCFFAPVKNSEKDEKTVL